jgi:serine/threonine protein kinase
VTGDYLRDRLSAAIGDHYLIEDELGRGGMAAVYRARDVRLNRPVAIKLLPPDMAFNAAVRSRFLREAQMAAQLSHPNIVPIYTVDERDGLVFFVMALVEGSSVARLLAESGRFEVEQVRRIVAAVADALEYAHRQGVVHRDIKPDNILIERATGRPMVTDFGIARAAAEESRLTVTGIAVGTPAYMSPEQAMGERDVDGRSDIYSLGVVAYQMLVGETPFKAANTPAMLMKHVSEPPPSLRSKRSEVPKALAATLDRALAKRPQDRWAAAVEFRDAILGRIEVPQAHQSVVAPDRSAPPPPAPRRDVGSARFEHTPPLRPYEVGEWRPAPVPAPPAGAHELQELRDVEKVARFRRRLAVYGATSVMLAGINIVTSPEFAWFLFPVLGMGIGVMAQLGSMWGDGLSLKRIFLGAQRRRRSPGGGHDAPAGPTLQVAPELLRGPHGPTIQRAVASHAVVNDMLARMTKQERELLPADLPETVQALADRVTSVGTTLHRLDSDANGSALGSLDARIATLKGDAQTPENERRLALLERQRSTLHDLMERRNALLAQMESAALALENLKLDLVRFRSAGVTSALEDVTSATREARAVSRDIGLMLDAQDEVRKL